MADAPSAEEIERRAIELIPTEIEKFLKNVNSARTRALLLTREFESLSYRVRITDTLEASLLRLFAAELIRKAGVKKFGKTPVYNRAKMNVRKKIVEYINGNPAIKQKFEKAVKARQKGLFARSKRLITRRRR